MAKATERTKGKEVAVTSDDVRRAAGAVSDHSIEAIMELNPTLAEIQVAVAFLTGAGDVPDRAGHPLSGNPARIYEIFSADELYQESDR